jgi:hypothetical protein
MSYTVPVPLNGKMRLRSDPQAFARVKEIPAMGHIRSVFTVAAVMVLLLAASALPAAAENFGPAFFCDAQSFSNCTDTSDPALAEDTFSCEGTVRDIASCRNLLTGESAPYCVFMGEDMAEGASTNRDAYLCRGSPERFNDAVNHEFWYLLERAQQQVGYP